MKQTTIRLACVAVLGFGTLVGFALASPASAGSVWVPNQQYVDCLHLMAFEARYNNGHPYAQTPSQSNAAYQRGVHLCNMRYPPGHLGPNPVR